MLKRFCDKCKREIDSTGEVVSFYNKRWDLCPECAEELNVFMDTKPKPKKIGTSVSAKLICERCKKPVNTGYFVQQFGKSLKVCSKCYHEIVRP